jgi:hypothetical protein
VSADWKSDLAELFRERRRSRGMLYATRRLIVDFVSVTAPRPRIGDGLQDVRHAFRLFRKHTGVVSITVAGLSLAIAMCTTVFSILNGAILRPYGMEDPATVVKVERLFDRGNSTSWPYFAFVELQRNVTLSSVQASLNDGVRLENSPGAPAQRPEPVQFVSGGYLKMLGGRAAIGRTLDSTDDQPGAVPVVVLSNSYWKHHLNSDRAVVGRSMRLGVGAVTVAGVLEPKFSGPVDRTPSFWAPFAAYGAIYGAPFVATSPVQVQVIARTPAGAAASAAIDELNNVARALPPIGFDGLAVAPQKTTGVQIGNAASRIDGPDAASVYAVIVVIFVVLGLVLALASANVANLLLA